MTQQHTPEPRHTFRDGTTFIVMSAQGDAVIAGDAAIEDARRIVAAVNACTGIRTDELERCRRLVFYANTDSTVVEQMAAALEGVDRRFGLTDDSDLEGVRAALAAYRKTKGGE